MAVPVLAAAPGTGVVIEGLSVPGAELSYSRAQVEAAFGSPKFCQTAGKRSVTANVQVLDELDQAPTGATVHATWSLPNGKQQSVSGQTDSVGAVEFRLNKANRRGTYTFSIDNVALSGFEFDVENSVLSASITK